MAERRDLVSVEWLRNRLNTSDQSNIVVLDVSWSSTKDMEDQYKQGHIPSAIYFSVMDGEHTEMFPRNIPSIDKFQEKSRLAGINSDSHLVLYSDSDACGFFLSGRAWWTFKLFGLENVSILDGGWSKWKSTGGPMSTDIPRPQKGNFTAQLSDAMRQKFDYMTLSNQSIQVCDSRPAEKYNGKTSTGHITGARNIPMSTLMDQEQGTLKSLEDIKQAFVSAGIDLGKPLVTYCNSGMSSCTLAFAAKLCGNQDVAVYHGGFTEWSKRAPADQIEK